MTMTIDQLMMPFLGFLLLCLVGLLVWANGFLRGMQVTVEPGMIFRRRSDQVRCEIVEIYEYGALLVRNCATGRRFNLTTWGLWRKYSRELD
jgi:hypothetical protein